MNTLTADTTTTTTPVTEDRRHEDRRATDATPAPIPFIPFIPASELARVADTVVTLGRELQAVAEIVEAAVTPTEIEVEDTAPEATTEVTPTATETLHRVKRTHRSKATNLHVFITNDRTKERTWARTDDKDTNFVLTVKKLRRAIMTLAPQIGDTFTITPHPTVLVDIGTVLQATTEENLISLTWEKSALQTTVEQTPAEVTQ